MLNKLKPTLAIVDSGFGGISVLRRFIKKYGCGNYIYYADNQFMPYGTKNKEVLINRLNEIIAKLNEQYKPDKIIVACNTASCVLIGNKPAENVILMPFNKHKTYLTTTLTAKRLTNSKCIPLKNLAKLIERNLENKNTIHKIVKTYVKLYKLYNYKELVLGCTHFELVADEFKKICPNTCFVHNSDLLLKNLHFSPKDNALTVMFLTSKLDEKYVETLRTLAFN